MKKIKLLFVGLALSAAASVSAQSIFSENFDGPSPLANWTLIDVDGLTPHPNVAVVNNAWVVLAGTGGDNYAASTSWYSPAGTSNDYMITPAINLTSNNYLFYSAQAPDANFRDGYELRISTTTPTVAGLNANPPLFTTAGESATWVDRQINLSAYAGQTVYIGWRNNSNDKYLLFVNDVEVKEVYSNDARIASVDINNTQTTGNTVTVRGRLENTGLNNLTSVHVNWSIDGGVTVNTDTLTTNVPSFVDVPFTHTMTLQASNPGNFTDIMVWTSNPNMVPDSNTIADTISTRFFVNNGTSVSKNVLLEEFTTAPCQFCPDGAVVVEQILASNPAVVAVGEHACFGTDAMTIPEATTYCNAFGSGAPTACIDRVLFPGEDDVAHGRGTWAANANSQSMLTSPVGVSLTGSFNSTTNAATVNVNTNFVDYALPGDLRITLFVVEDSVTGTGSGYNQVNFYNNQAGHPYAGAGNPIVGFVHRHVLRDVYPTNDAWGEAGIIPMNPAPNSNYSKTFTVNMSNTWKTKDVSLVAFVSYFNTNTSEREVLNVDEVKLNNLVTSIEEIKSTENTLKVYPNPTADLTNFEFNLLNSDRVSIALRDITGKLISTVDYGVMNTGNQKVTLDLSTVTNGIYFATMTVGENTIVKKISVNK